MDRLNSVKKKLIALSLWFLNLSSKKKLLLLGLVVLLGWFLKTSVTKNQQQIQYQTAQAEKGTLVASVTVTGSVAATAGIEVSTQASGIVSEVYVKNGDYVEAGATIAKMTLDQQSLQKQTAAYASYLSAKNTFDAAGANAYSLRSGKDTTWKKFYDLATSSTYQNSDGSPRVNVRNSSAEFQSAEGDWLAAEAKYKNQQAVITQAQVAMNAAWLTYRQTQAIIASPITGTVTNLAIGNGSVIKTGSSDTNGTTSSTRIAAIKTTGSPTVSVNLTEIDVPKVEVGDRATLTFDAFPGKTFTGKVIAIDTMGSVSSGVTSYPATISIDAAPKNLYPNMSASASIITDTKDNTILVPVSAVQTQNDQSTVRILKNGKVEQKTVEIGLSNDIQIEIVSGLSEGESVITGETGASQSTGQSTSPFGGRSIGGGTVFRMGGSGQH